MISRFTATLDVLRGPKNHANIRIHVLVPPSERNCHAGRISQALSLAQAVCKERGLSCQPGNLNMERGRILQHTTTPYDYHDSDVLKRV